MKKGLFILLSIVFLVACSNESSENNPQPSEEENKSSSENKKSKYPFPEETTPIGDASITVSTASGDSKDGNVPVLYVNKDTFMESIRIDYENFQGDKETFVYINKIYHHTGQYGELTQSSEGLEEDFLKPGYYTITAVQFEDNDPTKKPITFAEAKYEIKSASE